ncbi:hypothetical protein ACFV97_13930 [Streptomyces sp. NPDC059913]|uniref:hypothetical protein n=1 Tax=unclassified Streptomyces TaxID=2593676 RepID=UPI00366641FA
MRAVAEHPVFDPRQALGWRDVALDGLNCVLRCVEATLVQRGYTPQQVARCLAGDLGILGRDMAGEFPGCALPWRFADGEGERHWEFVRDSVSAGTPVIVMPDRFFWPGDEFEGRFHFHDHAVLAYDWDAERGVLTVLDTDADPAKGYRRELVDTPSLRAACTRVTTVEVTAPVDNQSPDAFGRQQIATRTAAVAAEAVALRGLFGRLRAEGIRGELGRGLHVLVLGQIQPLMFLYGEALTGAEDPAVRRVREAALAVSGATKRLGQALIAAHGRDDRERAYEAALSLSDRLVDAFDRLVAAMRDAGGSVAGSPDPEEIREAFHARLVETTEKCFGGTVPI